MSNKESQTGIVAAAAILAFLAGAGVALVAERAIYPSYVDMMRYPRYHMTAPMGFHMGDFDYRNLPNRMPMMRYWGR